MCKDEETATNYAVVFKGHPLVTAMVHTKEDIKEEIFDIITRRMELCDDTR